MFPIGSRQLNVNSGCTRGSCLRAAERIGRRLRREPFWCERRRWMTGAATIYQRSAKLDFYVERQVPFLWEPQKQGCRHLLRTPLHKMGPCPLCTRGLRLLQMREAFRGKVRVPQVSSEARTHFYSILCMCLGRVCTCPRAADILALPFYLML